MKAVEKTSEPARVLIKVLEDSQTRSDASKIVANSKDKPIDEAKQTVSVETEELNQTPDLSDHNVQS